MATYGGDLSLEHFLVLESRAVPFDAAHAIGNVVFALIAGPAMIRMLSRFRERFEWRTPAAAPPALAATLLLALALVTTLPATAGAADTGEAASWLASVQNGDGGFGDSPGDDSSTSTTAWAMLGLEAAGRNPLDVAARRQDAGRLPALEGRRAEQQPATSPARSSPSKGPASTRAPSAAATWSRRCSTGAATTAPTKAGRAAPPSRSSPCARPAPAAASTSRSPGWATPRTATAAGATRPGAPSNADVTGAAMQAMPELEGGRAGPLLPAQAPAQQRRLLAGRRAAPSTRSRPPGRSRG